MLRITVNTGVVYTDAKLQLPLLAIKTSGFFDNFSTILNRSVWKTLGIYLLNSCWVFFFKGFIRHYYCCIQTVKLPLQTSCNYVQF